MHLQVLKVLLSSSKASGIHHIDRHYTLNFSFCTCSSLKAITWVLHEKHLKMFVDTKTLQMSNHGKAQPRQGLAFNSVIA